MRELKEMRKWITIAWLIYIVMLILKGEIIVEGGIKLEHYNRNDFPLDFVFGAATSAYQVEGAALEDGRTPSIFDTIAHSGQVSSDGDVACDEYHRYKEDVHLMVETGLDAYRFSISWSRLIPNGRGSVNPKGLEYYNNLINELISHGIEPHVTLLHSDTPQVLEDEYQGLLSPKIIEDFAAYVDVCFREFGDRVKYWTTFNEANILALGGYDVGNSPPARCSFPFGLVNCTAGNSTTEPYIAAHNILLAHASAARIYKESYQAKQHGIIGFNLFAYHFLPLRNATEDILAAQRSYSFLVGWFMHPFVYGDYPEIMKRRAGIRIPHFTKSQSELVKGSIDFIGINYYTVMFVKHTQLIPEPRDYIADRGAAWFFYNRSSELVPSEVHSYPILPWGLQGVLEYFKNIYGNPPIFIHENGQVTEHNVSINDPSRIEYLQAHIGSVLEALRNGSNTKGYFVWSFLDVFELLFGYDYTYGLYYVDFDDPSLPRVPKLSQKCLPTLVRQFQVAAEEHKCLNRNKFPSDFIFGAGTSAYQVEGAAQQDGRTPSIFDTFAHNSRDDIYNPDVACEEYYKYKEDVQLMVETGLDAYRFSISWSRLIPNGRGVVNPKGLRYYNNLINELIIHGIEPHVTLMHSDIPQILEDEYRSCLDPRIIDDFATYADVCFREFGDRVRYWTTFNEPNIFVFGGYDVGDTPPNRCSSPFGKIQCCTKGNSTIEPYLAAHHILLAHASTARLYKEKYQAKQLGFVGINLLTFHYNPFTNTRKDINAARRAYDFMTGWFMHPLTYGDYPPIMKKNAASKIPVFTKNQSDLVKGSSDFVGINYYSIMTTKDDADRLASEPTDFFGDMAVEWVSLNDTSAPLSKEVMFSNNPWGLESVLDYFKEAYENPPIFIHENGQASKYSTSINDPFRIEFLHDHISSLLKATRNGSNTKGYIAWSLLDVYELLYGFNYTFGLYYVNFSDPNLSRHPKMSQKWYSALLKGENVTRGVSNNQVENTSSDLLFSA